MQCKLIIQILPQIFFLLNFLEKNHVVLRKSHPYFFIHVLSLINAPKG